MRLIKDGNRALMSVLLVGFVFLNSMSFAASDNNPWKKSFSLEQNKHYLDAAKVLEPMLNTTPKNEFLLLRLGWLYYLQTEYNTSISYYKKALELNSDSIDARLGLTLPLLAQQRWKEAALYAKEVIKISAWDYNANVRLMTSESALLQWEILEPHAAEMAKRYPSDPTVYIFLARAQAWQGKKTLAIKNYQLVLERSPDNQEALDYLKKHQ
ncbi:lipopolysaccharide assembly protein LapB [Legionella sp. km535]|uniref:tetratricopeptide repeat protein n=1 Tax=Legionella sp. km535 TaxID=2498107 RepID=UPI0013153EB7|nr:tetratricopeptide repeat protein [Legionella sp. km535]